MNFIAHRGNNSHGFKENSVDAFISCFKTSYIDGIELDVRLTIDNVVVISHNNLVDGKLINKSKFSMLSGIDSLDYVLRFLSNKKKIVIDIKADKKIINYLYDVIKKYDYSFYICSFDYDLVTLFKKKYPNYKVGLIIGYLNNIDMISNDLDFNVLHYSLINRIDKSKENFIWTINSKFIYQMIKKYQDINIITDCSYLLK